jgi:hypothetical protein
MFKSTRREDEPEAIGMAEPGVTNEEEDGRGEISLSGGETIIAKEGDSV